MHRTTVPCRLLGVLAGQRRGGEGLRQQKWIKNYLFQAKFQAAFLMQSNFLAKGRPAQYASNLQNVRVTFNAWTKISSLNFSCIQTPKKIARPTARVMLFRPFFSNTCIYHQLGHLLNTTYLAREARFIISLRILLFSRQL